MRIPTPISANQLDPHTVLLELEVLEELVFFPGHFPQQSVLPGVVMVDWAIEFAQQYLPVSVQFKTMEALKFRQVVTPPMKVLLRLEFKAKTEKLHFSYEGGQGQAFSSGKISRVSLLES